MPIINRIAEYFNDMKEWRQHIHANPELMFDTRETADFVVGKLKEFGVDEIHEGIAQNGLVAIIRGQGAGPVIGLRADMDALPMSELNNFDHKSKIDGKMHACGHDGHTTMLLGAARYLAETRNFSGAVALIFQPAEEGGGGGQVMCQEGIMERFAIDQVYGVHNAPNFPVGQFMLNPGALMASADTFEINITGKGAHAAYPDQGIDPIMVAVQITQAIQTIRSRNVPGLENLVISVTQIHAGTTDNIIPETAFIGGTVRNLNRETRAKVPGLMQRIVDNTAAAFGATAVLDYEMGYPVTMNDPEKAAFAANIARDVAGADLVLDNIPPEMGAEDFSYMLEERPGAYLFIGQGEGANVHHPEYDFNDEINPIGASYFVKLVEAAQPVSRM